MLKNFLFGALFLNMIAIYISYNDKKENNKPIHSYFIWISGTSLIMMIGLTLDLFFNAHPFLLNSPILLWGIIATALIIGVFSIFIKNIAGQLIAASLLLFLVMPTILSIGIFLLISSILFLIIVLFTFYKRNVS